MRRDAARSAGRSSCPASAARRWRSLPGSRRRARSRGWRGRGSAASGRRGLELGQQAVDVVDVPRALDLRTMITSRRSPISEHQRRDVVQRHGDSSALTRSSAALPRSISSLAHEAGPAALLVLHHDGVLEVAERHRPSWPGRAACRRSSRWRGRRSDHPRRRDRISTAIGAPTARAWRSRVRFLMRRRLYETARARRRSGAPAHVGLVRRQGRSGGWRRRRAGAGSGSTSTAKPASRSRSARSAP